MTGREEPRASDDLAAALRALGGLARPVSAQVTAGTLEDSQGGVISPAAADAALLLIP
jgi:hypothetical protein